ncbi:MAG: Asp23/Gls24 family envelope stress response protein [Bacillota bacterium]
MPSNHSEAGRIKIANEVLSVIASIAATEVEGVAGMSVSVPQGLAELFRLGNTAKGVRVQMSDDMLALDLFITIDYQAKLPEVAWKVQENVKKAVETMTGLVVDEINVHIQGVKIPREEKPREAARLKQDIS